LAVGTRGNNLPTPDPAAPPPWCPGPPAAHAAPVLCVPGGRASSGVCASSTPPHAHPPRAGARRRPGPPPPAHAGGRDRRHRPALSAPVASIVADPPRWAAPRRAARPAPARHAGRRGRARAPLFGVHVVATRSRGPGGPRHSVDWHCAARGCGRARAETRGQLPTAAGRRDVVMSRVLASRLSA